MGNRRRQLRLTPVRRLIVSNRLAWLPSKMLKTRVGTATAFVGSRGAEPPCQGLPNVRQHPPPAAEFQPALTVSDLADLQALRATPNSGDGSAESNGTAASQAVQGHSEATRLR